MSSSVDPGPTIAFALRGSPSVVRWPAEMSFWTWLRDNPVTSATNRSTRSLAASSGTRRIRVPGVAAPGPAAAPASMSAIIDRIPPRRSRIAERRSDGQQDQHEDRPADRRVGDVERVPANAADAGVDEVDDIAETQPVRHVAERPTEQQAEGDRQVRASPGPRVIRDDEPDHDDRDEPEDRGVVAEQPEQRPVVLAIHEPERVADDRHRGARRQRG